MTKTNITEESSDRPAYLICKYGGYYRPNSQGYTDSAIVAGRYTLAEAESITHPNGPKGPRDGMTYVHQDEVKDEDWMAHRAAIADLSVTPQEAAPDWEGFGRAMMEGWPTRDIEGSELFELSLKYGLIAEVPGGYDPEQHIDAEGICPEKGDPWYEYTFREANQQ